MASITVREARIAYSGKRRKLPDALDSTLAAAKAARAIIGSESQEVFLAIPLDSRLKPLAYCEVTRGTLNQSLVHPREVFRLAIALGAHSILVAHNHPSGDAAPSDADREVTRRLRKAGEVVGISLVDHIVVTDSAAYYSFKEHSAL